MRFKTTHFSLELVLSLRSLIMRENDEAASKVIIEYHFVGWLLYSFNYTNTISKKVVQVACR